MRLMAEQPVNCLENGEAISLDLATHLHRSPGAYEPVGLVNFVPSPLNQLDMIVM